MVAIIVEGIPVLLFTGEVSGFVVVSECSLSSRSRSMLLLAVLCCWLGVLSYYCGGGCRWLSLMWSCC